MVFATFADNYEKIRMSELTLIFKSQLVAF
jgi:hypothetical protein